MKKFSTFLREMRETAGISQAQLARNLGVSTLLIALIETEKREPSKKFVSILANKLDVKSASILPFISDETIKLDSLNGLEKRLISLIEELQSTLIKNKSHKLSEYV